MAENLKPLDEEDQVGRVSFSPDGKILASASDEGTMKLWNVNTGKEITTLKIPLQNFTDKVFGVSFSPDSKTIAYVSWDNTVKLWDVNTGREIKILKIMRV
ncbi:MAG: hypothetical protein HC917_28545 [Richelia sp. SM2_1_7]|nr:hypothetical protein [Richelia sp. SM2_1_7]